MLYYAVSIRFDVQGFPEFLIGVGHFLDSVLWERFWTGSLEIPIRFVQQGCY